MPLYGISAAGAFPSGSAVSSRLQTFLLVDPCVALRDKHQCAGAFEHELQTRGANLATL